MNKKPFNEIEEQIKASAGGWEPSFDEASWEHMEKMLDGQDDRRRPIAWWVWLIPVLLGGVITGYFFMGNREDKEGHSNNKITSSKDIQEKLSSPVIPNDTTVGVGLGNTGKETSGNVDEPTAPTTAQGGVDEATEYSSFSSASTKANMRARVSSPLITDDVMFTIAAKDREKKMTAASANISVSAATASETNNENQKAVVANADPIPAVVEQTNDTAPSLSPIKKNEGGDSAKKIKTEPLISAAPTEEKKSRSLSKFYFSVSGGIDGTGVDFPGLNKFAPRIGLSVGYHLNNNLSVASGIFAGNKKYVAGKDDYKAKAGSYWALVDIKEVDANCRVFEIPLWLRYDFSEKKSLRPFAMAGISSFIMDKEDYEYYYYRSGNPYWAEHSYKGNSHLFSVLRLVAGLEKKVSDNFFLSLQPGLAIPLAGVGEGQVKLYSTELLIGLKYRPFKKAK